MISAEQQALTLLGGLVLLVLALRARVLDSEKASEDQPGAYASKELLDEPVPLLECIRARRSVFPRSYVPRTVSAATMSRMLEAAMWAPFHGSVPPWRFVVLGRRAMVDMQQMTLEFYDAHWRTAGWANGKQGTEAEYLKWRQMTEEEINGRWGPVSYMVAIVMQRQAGSKRMPERAPRVPKVGPAREAGGPWAATGRCAGAPAAS